MKRNTKRDYDHQSLEKKWQKIWEKKKVFQAKDNSKQKKFYSLIEFPYPSGDGLHVGHIRSNTAMDIVSRKRRMEGYNVLYPIGWDAFGLPTENYAIKTGLPPAVVTKRNTDNFRKQLKSLGFSFDWSREVNTTDPKYYKWTQWMFLQFLKHDLAYKAKIDINWCPKDKIGLANEEVVNGCCERCGTKVEKREKEQWMIRITKYADRLDKDLDTVDYLEKIKIQQRNWIGKSEGAEIPFKIVFRHGQKPGSIPVFTTRADTLYGATFMVLSPEHPWVTLACDESHKDVLNNRAEVKQYVAFAKIKTEIERTAEDKEKTGIELKGVKAVNPATGEEIPIFVADYVLATYGTGAVMAVPAHDERDFTFAKKYNLPVKIVIEPETGPILPNEQLRKSIIAIVEDKKQKKFLTLNWGPKLGGTLFIGGGIEEGENEVDAAKREIVEETGYTNIKFVGKTEKMHHHYFAFSKNVARNIEVIGLHFELVDEEMSEKNLQHDEKGNFKIEWLTEEEILKKMEDENHLLSFKRLVKGKIYSGNGILTDSGRFTGHDSEKAKKEITGFVGGKIITKYKLRDWVFSRQRYWGEPIPVVHCEACGVVPLPEKDLPLKLPKIGKYEPTDTGESPLAGISKWVNTKCPKCKNKAKRETDTMPNWAGSSWYFLRYIDPKNSKKFADPKKLKHFMPVDWYNGGMEHTTLHLLYSRFWNKFLYDIGFVPTSEPYKKRTSHGLILIKGGEKMSKSKGNVINPDEIVKMYGADTLRTYEMFMGPFDQAIVWGEDNIFGVLRFLERVWRLQEKVSKKIAKKSVEHQRFERLLHKTVKKVSDDIENMAFNTAISAMMILVNEMEKIEIVNKKVFEMFLKILSPFAPHIAEEIWNSLGNKKLIALEKWPKADPKKIKESEIKIAIQINNKVRAECIVSFNAKEAEVVSIVKGLPDVNKWLMSKEIKRIIFVPNKLINFVVV
ncbi:MAG: class I tRNA ligase family protein [Minisyncoccia bacterium]